MSRRGHRNDADTRRPPRQRRDCDRHQKSSSSTVLCLRIHHPPIAYVFLGIGSNIDAEKNLQTAASILREEFPTIRFSPVYTSAPVGVTDQADFLNAVASLETALEPQELALKLQEIEKALKKNITTRFGPRTIDLDLLLYDQDVIQTDTLTVPHPRMHERAFVLLPLIDMDAGNFVHPTLQQKLSSFLSDVQEQQCDKTAIVLA